MLTIDRARDEPLTLLCLGAHSDDIEIGCGGTILRLTGDFSNVRVVWVVFAAADQRAEEARHSADAFLQSAQGKTVIVKDFRDVFVRLDENTCRTKIQYLLDGFRTQAGRQWFTEDTFLALLRLRGIESPIPTTYAEAFYCRKLAL